MDILREWFGMDSLLFITTKDVLVLVATIPLMIALQYFVTRTRWGKAMRATAQDKETALAMGIDVEKTIILTFFIGGALAGAAGLIQGLYYNIGMWWMGYQAGLRAFTAAVLGGIGSMPGAALGGLVIGFLSAWSDQYISARWTNAHRLLDPDPGPRLPAAGASRRARPGQGVSEPGRAPPAARGPPASPRSLAYPFLDRWLQAQTVHAVTDAMIYVLLALGLNIVVGYAGLLDLGYAAFFAIGAYTMGLLNSPVLGSPLYGHAWSFWVVIWIAALVVSAGLGVVIGAPTLRVRGDYLAIITLAFGEIIPVAIRNLGDITIDIGGWRPVERLNLTGGENGVNPVGPPAPARACHFETDFIPWYFLILVIGACSLWAMNRLRDSRLGRAWMAIREDETAADCTGVEPGQDQAPGLRAGRVLLGLRRLLLRGQAPGHHAGRLRVQRLDHAAVHGRARRHGQPQGRDPGRHADHPLRPHPARPDDASWCAGSGARSASPRSRRVDLTLWRWFFFGLGLVVIMLIRARRAGRPARARRPPRTWTSARRRSRS